MPPNAVSTHSCGRWTGIAAWRWRPPRLISEGTRQDTMLLSCGDALIDFMPVKVADGRDAFMPAVGGSCLNVAVAMARLDAPAGLAGGISTDLFGTMIAEHALRSNVDLRYAIRSSD